MKNQAVEFRLHWKALTKSYSYGHTSRKLFFFLPYMFQTPSLKYILHTIQSTPLTRMCFGMFTGLTAVTDFGTLSSPTKEAPTHELSPPPRSPVIPLCLLSLPVSPLRPFHKSGITQRGVFCVRLLSLTRTFTRLPRVVGRIPTSFLFIAKYYSV